jgi:glycosyltransferase involved in cell wall biosynthesis
MDVTVVIPIYNEKENIEPLLDELERALTPSGRTFEVLAVDDGSTDGSAQLLTSLVGVRPYLKAVILRRNSGQTAAFSCGFALASGRCVATLDADLQNDPADLCGMLAKLEDGYDVVTGWRKNRQDTLLVRKIPSRIANAIIRRVTGTAVHDLGCSIRVYRKEITDQLRLYGEMHRFIVVLAEGLGARVCEVPVNHRARRAGHSKYGIGRTFKVVLDLFTVWFMGRFQSKPIYLFGGAGLTLMLGSVVTAGWVLWEKYAEGAWVHRNPLFIIALTLGLFGAQILALGVVAEILIRIYFETGSTTAYSVREKLGFDRATKPAPQALTPQA